jgi:hypothetical protein
MIISREIQGVQVLENNIIWEMPSDNQLFSWNELRVA